MKIYLTRHGQTEWNLLGKMQGRLNSNLTELGQNQALWLGKYLEATPIDVICSSSSGRAYDTAKLIRGDRAIDIEQYDDLQEVYLAEWQGQLHADIESEESDQFNAYWRAPEKFNPGEKESFEALIKRGSGVLNEIIKKHDGKDVLIVSHGVTLKAILAYIKSLAIKDFWSGPFMKSACLNVLEVKDGHIEILIEGETTHYEN
jgi:probable phosphoglycerate mutase